ncbi:flagellar protein FliT [Cytobacillus sp. Hz8]|uniref:flagellar protein FliT n=1 Tax=Cytobacillus sp. Hz8 TaxID=3347168 RepID=UPI0035DAE9DD
MNPVQQFYQYTSELIEILEKSVQPEERDGRIERVQQLLNLRETTMREIKKPLNQEDQAMMQKIFALNQKLSNLLEKQKRQIQLDIKGLKQKKVSTNKYVNPYQKLSASDGMFYDRRK